MADLRGLAAQVREQPRDLDLRRVFADVLQEHGDPRGEWIARVLDSPDDHEAATLLLDWTQRQLKGCGLQEVRIQDGLVTQVRCESPPPLDWLATEPLAVPIWTAPFKEEERQEAMPQWAPAFRCSRGLVLKSRLTADTIDVLLPWVAATNPEVLSLDVHDDIRALLPVDLGAVRVAHVRGNPTLLLEQMPSLEHLQLEGPLGDVLPELLERPALKGLDLRGVPLESDDLEKLRAWRGQVVHEQLSLAPLPGDPFGFSGLWSNESPTTTRCAFGPELLAVRRGSTLSLYTDDAPDRQIELDGNDAPDDLDVPLGPLGLARPPLPVTMFGNGVTWQSGEHVDLGEPPRALRVDPQNDDVALVIAGLRVWRVTKTGSLEHLGTCPNLFPRLDIAGPVAAWTPGPNSVTVVDGDKRRHASYPGGYQNSDDELRIGDVAVVPGGTALVALEEAGANLLTASGYAMKLDPFPGEQSRRWIFFYNGQILVAD